MNGRLYDPKLHRFLMPDNNIQGPTNSQNYNRYGYVLNNPLMYVDPSGESFWSDLGDAFSNVVKQIVNSVIIPVVTVAVGIVLIGIGLTLGTTLGILQSVGTGFQNNSILTNEARILGGLFQGNIGQIASRFTKELPQTLLGLGLSLGANGIGRVKSVSYFGGATVVEHYQSGWGAFTTGSYINGQEGIYADPENPLFKHEYGHYLQSQEAGWNYISDYALPSFFSAKNATRDSRTGKSTHHSYWTETDANRRAIDYFGADNWDTNNFPINGIGISIANMGAWLALHN